MILMGTAHAHRSISRLGVPVDGGRKKKRGWIFLDCICKPSEQSGFVRKSKRTKNERDSGQDRTGQDRTPPLTPLPISIPTPIIISVSYPYPYPYPYSHPYPYRTRQFSEVTENSSNQDIFFCYFIHSQGSCSLFQAFARSAS